MARIRVSFKWCFRTITGCWQKQPDIPPTAPSAITTPESPSATGGQHVQQDVSSAISPIPPAAPSASIPPEDPSPISPAVLSATIRLEDPSAAGSNYIQQEQSRDSLPATFPAEKSLWDRAYNALAKENPDLVGKYDKLLAEEEPMTNQPRSETTPSGSPEPHDLETHFDLSPRQAQLKTVIQKGLRRMEDNKAKFKIAGREIDLEDKITKAANILLWGKEFIGSAVKNSPEASLVWAGVSLIIPLFTNPTTAAEANRDGFSYVTSRMDYYVALEPMVRRLDQNASLDKVLVTAVNNHIVDLYHAILDFQLSSVLRFYQSRFKVYIHDTVTPRDWEETLLGITTREDTVNNALGQINDLAAREKLELLDKTSEETRVIMEDCLSVATEQLTVSKKQLTVAEKQLAAQEDEKQERLLAKQRKEERECLQAFWLTDNGKGATYDWYKDRVESRVEGTCNWFLQHDNFQKWLWQESGPLLVSADPGCGKSVLAKYLIDDGLAKQSATICYFFFKDQDQNTIRQALCALLHQLFSQKRTLIRHAMELYNDMGAKLVQSEQSLWTILRNAVRDPEAGPVIFVIDALDECDESQLNSLITNMEKMFRDQQLANANFKILMTSRPYQHVVNEFYTLQELFRHIRIPGEEKFEAVSQEINSVILHRVEQLAKKHQLSDNVRSSLNSKLLAINHRTYLWVYLVFDHLDKGFNTLLKKTEDGIDTAIQTLPESVNQAYDQILNRSQEVEVVKTVKRALSIILAARRPLTLSEMNIAMSLDGHCRGRFIYNLDLEQDMDFKSRLRTLCGLFVNVHQDKVYFLHQTAREFLIQSSASTTVLSSLQWHHSITMRHAHSVLADICMFYLDWLNSIRTESFYPGDRHDALLDYSVEHWGDHCREAEFEKGSAMVDFASRLCTPDWTSDSQWASIFSERYHISSGLPRNVLVASRFGLTHVTELLLSRGADIRAEGEFDVTALILAASKGHEAVVRLLLENGADINARDANGFTALHCAANLGHEATTRLLLEYRAAINVRTNYDMEFDMTPLMCAAQFGHETIVRLLLENGAHVEAGTVFGRTPLMAAAQHGEEAIARLLLEYHANVEETDESDGKTALMQAAESGHEAVARLLLENGADINAREYNGKTALIHAAAKGHEAVTRLLLGKGADVDASEDGGCTALMAAARYGHEAVVRLLLEKGADINARDVNGATALHYAASFGHEAITRLLLEYRADVHTRDDNFSPALTYAALAGHEAVTRLLLDMGANVEATDFDGMTPLIYAAKNGHEAVVRLLLKNGADIKTMDHDGKTAAIYAAENGHFSITRLIPIKVRMVKACDWNKALTASRHAPEITTQLPLDDGAQAEAKDDE